MDKKKDIDEILARTTWSLHSHEFYSLRGRAGEEAERHPLCHFSAQARLKKIKTIVILHKFNNANLTKYNRNSLWRRKPFSKRRI